VAARSDTNTSFQQHADLASQAPRGSPKASIATRRGSPGAPASSNTHGRHSTKPLSAPRTTTTRCVNCIPSTVHGQNPRSLAELFPVYKVRTRKIPTWRNGSNGWCTQLGPFLEATAFSYAKCRTNTGSCWTVTNRSGSTPVHLERYRRRAHCMPLPYICRTRNFHVASANLAGALASSLEQAVNLLCAQANSASYSQRGGK